VLASSAAKILLFLCRACSWEIWQATSLSCKCPKSGGIISSPAKLRLRMSVCNGNLDHVAGMQMRDSVSTKQILNLVSPGMGIE
jgi:hypothetical protein